MLSQGENLFVITRRLFENDLRRHFVGNVAASSDSMVRLNGYLFVYDPSNNVYVRRDPIRTRLFPLHDATLVINVLPRDIDLDAVCYRVNKCNHLVLTDGKKFQLDINEFGLFR